MNTVDFPLAMLSQYVFGPLLFLLSTFITLIILLQRGRGGGLTGALGGAGGASAFGVKAGDIFTRITAVSVLLWIVLCSMTCFWYLDGKLDIEADSAGSSSSSVGGMGGMGSSEGNLDRGAISTAPPENSMPSLPIPSAPASSGSISLPPASNAEPTASNPSQTDVGTKLPEASNSQEKPANPLEPPKP